MKRAVIVLLFFIYLTSPSQVSAQFGRFGGGGYWGGGYGGYGGGYGAQTPFSAEQHGMADIVRSEGVYNALTTQGMVNYEEARGKFIDNADKWLNFYQKRKRYMEGEKAKEKDERRASLKSYLEFKADHPDTPPRLNSTKLNLETGEIKWPSALKRDCFASLRKDMEVMFISRAETGGSSELNMAIYKKTREIQDELRKNIKEIVVREFIDARKFLESLATEGTIPRS